MWAVGKIDQEPPSGALQISSLSVHPGQPELEACLLKSRSPGTKALS